MPVYNTAKYLRKAVESILIQTYTNFEFIIIDDASSDDSVAIIRSYQDNRIRLIINESNQGISRTRNRGLDAARGRYIAVFDSDDISLPDRIKKQVEFFEANPDYGLVGGQVIPISECGDVLGDVWSYNAEPEEIPVLLLFRNYFAQPSVMIRTTAVGAHRYDPSFTTAGDYDFWTRIVQGTKSWNLPIPLVNYRRHAEGITQRSDRAMSIESVERIVGRQLTYLGIRLSKEELKLFRQLTRNSYDPNRIVLTRKFKEDKHVLKECFRLLEKIEEANKRCNIYESTACKRILCRQKKELATLYARSRYINPNKYSVSLLIQFLFLPYQSYRYIPLKDTIRLILNCLIGYSKAKNEKVTLR